MAVTKLKPKGQARFDTRISREQKLYFEKASKLGGYKSLTHFVILAAQEKAKKIMSEQEQLLISEKDKEIFFNAITKNTGKPNKKLADAAKKYKLLLK